MTASQEIDRYIEALPDWRGALLARLRRAFLAADPAVAEAWKYRGSPVWECDGPIAVGNAHKDKVKLTFSHGADLEDPDSLFNNGKGSVWRAIDLFEGDDIDEAALTALVRRAIAHNRMRKRR